MNPPLQKTSQNIFAYSFVSEHSKHFLYFEKKKNLAFLVAFGSTPPPLSGCAFLTCSLCEMHIHTYFGLIRLIISKKKFKTFSSDEILNPGKTSDLIQEHYADRSVNMYISNLVSIYILKSGVN